MIHNHRDKLPTGETRGNRGVAIRTIKCIAIIIHVTINPYRKLLPYGNIINYKLQI
ncbi:hypothetical protein HanPSC8_Chr16g0695461 [Helianthus annuus]|nr:hypothetical protein HanPSC8_Chr16g0695461 [Helianthus annuus]